MSDDLFSKALDGDIAMVRERFVAAMQSRLPHMPLETKERYFAVFSTLVGKLEAAEKGLREIAHEMMAETMAIVLQEFNANR